MSEPIEAALRAAADGWERLRSAATPGPWEECKSSPYESSVHHIEADVCIASARMAENAEGTVPLRPRDAAFIAHAGNADVAGLLRRAAGEIRSLAASLDVNMRLADSNAAELVRRAAELEAERDRLREEVARLRHALRGPHVPDESSEI